jgi:hypothetical protein
MLPRRTTPNTVFLATRSAPGLRIRGKLPLVVMTAAGSAPVRAGAVPVVLPLVTASVHRQPSVLRQGISDSSRSDRSSVCGSAVVGVPRLDSRSGRSFQLNRADILHFQVSLHGRWAVGWYSGIVSVSSSKLFALVRSILGSVGCANRLSCASGCKRRLCPGCQHIAWLRLV